MSRFSDPRTAIGAVAIPGAVSGHLAHAPNPASVLPRNTLRLMSEKTSPLLVPRATRPRARWANSRDGADRCASSFGQRCFTLSLGPRAVDQLRSLGHTSL